MIDIDKMTAEEQEQALQQLMAKKEAEKVKVREDRQTYKELGSKAVDEMFIPLQNTSSALSDVKKLVFDNFAHLIDLKKELYDVKENQQSHTFSNMDVTKRITIGYRILDRYDDTAEAGIAKVREYMDSLVKDDDSARLVGMINSLLRRDPKGNLKANRVLELLKLASESDSALFKDGVHIIADAHRPEKSSEFIEAEYKDEHGKWHSVGLSISSVNFPSI
ncbi:MAG: DUF3164 family protein [Candidatus Peribacteraceae bacterium]|nr:DUF3164 family protein [Candidatus Peribacteraceae bacterium]